MSQNINAEKYYRKSALSIKISKYIVISLFIVFLISCIIVFRRDITIQNIQLLAKYISLDGASSNYTDEFSISSSKDSTTLMIRDNLAIIEKNNISLHDLSGQKLFSFNYSYSSPAVVNDDHTIIVYDIEGEELSLFNSFSKLKTMRFAGGIACADVKGDSFAVVSKEDSYRSVLTVYEHSPKENDYIESFKYKTSAYLTSVSLSDNERYVLTTAAGAEGGNYKSTVMIYDTLSSSSDPVYSANISGELPIFSGFSGDGTSAFTITDSSLIFYDSKLSESNSFKFNQSKIDNYFVGDKHIILSEKNNLSGNSMTLTCFDKHGTVIFKENIPDEISDIAFGNDCYFALGKKAVYKIIPDKEQKSYIADSPISEKYQHIVCDTDNNSYILNDVSANRVYFDNN